MYFFLCLPKLKFEGHCIVCGMPVSKLWKCRNSSWHYMIKEYVPRSVALLASSYSDLSYPCTKNYVIYKMLLLIDLLCFRNDNDRKMIFLIQKILTAHKTVLSGPASHQLSASYFLRPETTRHACRTLRVKYFLLWSPGVNKKLFTW